MTKPAVNSLISHNFNLDIISLDASSAAFPTYALIQQSFMHDLAREGDLLTAEAIYDAGGQVDIPNELGRRPLHEAAFFGHIDLVKFFLDHGADIDAPVQPLGHTALYLAVQQGHLAIARYLVLRGAKTDARDEILGIGLLHICAARGDTLMAGMLIAAGINVFRPDKKGLTARDMAARHGHMELSRTLLKVMEHHVKYVQ